MDQAFNVADDHADLIRNSIKLLRPEGTLYFSTNLRKFKLDRCIQDEFNVIDISAKTIPVDFSRRRNIHQCWQLSR
jgi:23S rRNA (guanine2445-N2)-methyltransferase / 23S rRNA (guanine2069-N7)-methyltransferase